jgi:beta-galactosidase
LEAQAVHDLGQVFIDGTRIGFLDRRTRKFSLQIPERSAPATLDVLVEAMGRVNFGVEVHDRKGLHAPVKLHSADGSAVELTDWKVFNLPLDRQMLGGLRFTTPRTNQPAFWRASLKVVTPADTFLDLRGWNKGMVWVNGNNLGRFWSIGPQQTMYLPGPWLHRGENEIIVLDLIGPEQPVIAGLEQPILDQLRPELDFSRVQRPAAELRLGSATLAFKGEFPLGAAVQEIKFNQTFKGRYFCLESVGAHGDKPYAAVAELDLLDASGTPLSHESWTVAFVDSEEREREDGTAENAIDGQTANFWHTQWGSSSPTHPHRLVLDLGRSCEITGFRYLPRQGAGDVGGRIKGFCVYIGDGLVRKKQ